MTDGPPLAFSACVVADDDRLLLMRRAFSQKVEPGVWTTALHGHPSPGELPEDAARRRALRVLGLRLDDVLTVLPAVPPPPALAAGASVTSMLVGRVRQRVVVPDPTQFDEAEWVRWPDLVGSVRDGSLRLADWCTEQVQRLDALGLPGTAWGTGAATRA